MKGLEVINVAIASLIILVNVYFLYTSWQILSTDGGPMGFGYMVLPLSISINLLLIPVYYALRKKNRASLSFLWMNSLGLLWALSWLFVLVFYNNP